MTTTEEMTLTVDQLMFTLRNLVESRWETLRQIAEEPNEKGECGVIKIAVAIELDFSGKVPRGAVNVSIPPRPIKDGATFAVEDADQEKLPLDDATVEMSLPDGTTTGPMPIAEFSQGVDKIRRRIKRR